MASADSALAPRLDEVGEADPALFTVAAPSFIDTWPIRLAIVRARAALMSMRLDDASKAISKLNRLLSTCSRSHFLRYSPSLRILRAFRLAAADDVEGARSLLVALPAPAANTLAATILWYADWRRGECEVYAADTLDYLDVPVGGKAVDRIYNLCMSAALAFERLHLTVSASLASEALDLARRRYGSHSPLTCLPATLLAQVAYEQGRLEEAEALLRPRISVIRAAGIPECVLRASVLLARIALHRGHARCALAALRDGEAIGRARRWPRLLSIASAEYARTLQAVRCYEDGNHEFRASPKRDHPGGGRDGRMLASSPNAPVRFSSVESALRRACATAADGRIDDSDKLLIQCLRTGAVHGLRMIFPDVGPQIFPLLESVYHTIAPNDLQLADLRPYIASILKSKPRRKTEEPAPSTYRSLSRREAGVLQMIARGMSNKRIAQSLGIAPETVKTHAKGILSKLETRTRAQAVARAEAIGLF